MMPEASKMRSLSSLMSGGWMVSRSETEEVGSRADASGGSGATAGRVRGERQPRVRVEAKFRARHRIFGLQQKERRATGFEILRVGYRRPRAIQARSIDRSLCGERVRKGKYDEGDGQYRREQRLSFPHLL